MNLYRNINRNKVQFDFLLHCPNESAYEKEILSLGGKIYKIPRYLGYNKYSYEKNLTGFLKAHPEHIIIHDHLMDSASETLRIAKKLGRISIAHSHAASAPFHSKTSTGFSSEEAFGRLLTTGSHAPTKQENGYIEAKQISKS